MMFLHRILFVVGNIILLGHFCLGTRDEKGLVIGVYSPSSFLTFTHIPEDSTSIVKNATWQLPRSDMPIFSITSDSSKGIIFAAISDEIYMYRNFSLWQNESGSLRPIFKGKSFDFGQIVFDYVSSNLYWCDSLHHWIAMKPAYNSDNAIYKVVVHKGLRKPRGLALDPNDRLMFFSDNGINPRIEKAYLDGQDREVIVHTGLSQVVSLSVDILNYRLYWVDNSRDTLEVINYDGSYRRVISRMNNFGLDYLFYYQNLLYGVDLSYQEMLVIDASSGRKVYSRILPSGYPSTINVYDAETQRIHNDSCSSLTCAHMCVNGKSGPQCLCAEGFNLSADGKTCTDKSWFFERGILVNNDTVFAMHEVHSVSGQKRSYSYMNISSNIIETFAVDAKLKNIYYVDSKTNALKKLEIISQQDTSLTFFSSSTVTTLVLDWIANLLGWIESHSNIMSYSINSGTSAIIYTNLQQPDALTVDAHNGVLYWISGAKGSRSIVRGTWTRESPRILISGANLNNPISLQYDVTNNRLYWIDGSQIKSSMTNGLDIKSHANAVGATKMFVYKGFFGWIRGDKVYFTRQSANVAENVVNTVQNSKSIVVFDASLQQDKRGTCDVLNGGCSDICIPLSNGRQCECDIGMELQTDNTCDSDKLVTDFIIVADFSHRRLLQINLQNGSIVKLPVTAKCAGVVFDKVTKTIFYTDIDQKTIMSTTLHGKNSSLFYNAGVDYLERLAIDYSTGNLYYTVAGSTTSASYIGVVHRTLLLHKTLFSNLTSPRDIVLYPSKGYLFWTELGDKNQIGRAYMDGTTRIYIATTDLGWPSCLAIDFTVDRLYWTDGKKDRIEFSDLNGGNRQVLATDTDADTDAILMSLVINDQYLYYTAWNRQRILKINKTTGTKAPFMSNHPELGRLDGMDIYADDFHDVSLSCSNKNGQCSTFCFPIPSGRSCGCQDNVNLQSNTLTCDGVSRCPTKFHNLNFINCLPYPGQSCDFECKSGHKSIVNTTISCISGGKWRPETDSLCKAEISNEGNGLVIYAGAAGGGAVVLILLVGIYCLIKSRQNIRGTCTCCETSFEVTFENNAYLDGVCDEGYVTIDDFSVKPFTVSEAGTENNAYLDGVCDERYNIIDDFSVKPSTVYEESTKL